jgi:nucleoside-diphosphate-sugar epimerase
MRVLITGGAGFVARRLTLKLLAAGAIAVAGEPRRAIERIVLADLAEPEAALQADPRIAAARPPPPAPPGGFKHQPLPPPVSLVIRGGGL